MRGLALVIAAAAALLLCCAPRALTPTVSGASVVTLVAPFSGLDEDGVELQPPRWAGYCNAFAVDAPLVPGRVLLLTAGHCVMPVGGLQRYLSPDGFGHGKALPWSSWGNDVSALLPLDPRQLRPLATATAPAAGGLVEAVSSLKRRAARGALVAELGPGVVETSLAIKPGWSGSPVLDESGAAWGVVTSCVAQPASALEGDLACLGEGAIVAVIR